MQRRARTSCERLRKLAGLATLVQLEKLAGVTCLNKRKVRKLEGTAINPGRPVVVGITWFAADRMREYGLVMRP